ncbi:hypothetical protein ES708_03319 [subsurface metagenome]
MRAQFRLIATKVDNGYFISPGANGRIRDGIYIQAETVNINAGDQLVITLYRALTIDIVVRHIFGNTLFPDYHIHTACRINRDQTDGIYIGWFLPDHSLVHTFTSCLISYRHYIGPCCQTADVCTSHTI